MFKSFLTKPESSNFPERYVTNVLSNLSKQLMILKIIKSKRRLTMDISFDFKQYVMPISLQNDAEYLPALREKLFNLVDDTKGWGFDPDAECRIEKYANNIVNSIEAYFSGDLIESYQIVDDLLNEIIKEKGVTSNILSSAAFWGPSDKKQEIQFFRARISDDINDFEAKEMLHIPFKKRELVTTQRFSIPGLPCIYLGNTSYCCWIELGKPADYRFNVSPVILDNELKFLNLITTGREVCDAIKGKVPFQQLELKIKMLMFNIATSYTVIEGNRSFKSEYIFAQMLMLACKKEGLNGIIYYSKRVKDEMFAMTAAINLVLFATYDGKDISDICNHVNIGKSFNYSMYKQLLSSLDYKDYNLDINNCPWITNIGDQKRQLNYKETWFYRFDKYLFANWDKEQDNWK